MPSKKNIRSRNLAYPRSTTLVRMRQREKDTKKRRSIKLLDVDFKSVTMMTVITKVIVVEYSGNNVREVDRYNTMEMGRDTRSSRLSISLTRN